MPRRRWIMIWVQETLHGTTLQELEPDERAVWFESLCAAGDSVIPGKICISEDIGYTNDQLARLLNVPLELLERSVKKLQKVGKIKLNHDNIIEIVNFNKYNPSEDALNKRRDYMAKYMRDYRGEKKKDKSK